MREQIENKRVGAQTDVRLALHAGDYGSHDFLAGGVSQGVNNAVMAVTAFAAQVQGARLAIEIRAPFDQLVDALRSFPHDHFHHVVVAQLASGRQRVLHVVLKAVFRPQHTGDSALGVVAVRIGGAFLGNGQHGKRRVHRQRRAKARQPSPDDQHIGETVRNPLGMKRHKISRKMGDHCVILGPPFAQRHPSPEAYAFLAPEYACGTD